MFQFQNYAWDYTTMSKSALKSVIFIIITSLFFSCEKNESEDFPDMEPSVAASYDSVTIIHDSFDLMIDVQGELKPWQEAEISLSDTAILIAYLAKEGDIVKKGDLLASAWIKSPKPEYTPFDIRASIDGIIERANLNIDQIIPANEPVVIIKNYNYLVLDQTLSTEKIKYIQRGQKASLNSESQPIQGIVKEVIPLKQFVSIWVDNAQLQLKESLLVSGHIHCGKVSGDYIDNNYFDETGTASVIVDGDIDLDIIKIGHSDSLALIFPPLPKQSYLKVLKKIDLIK